MCNQPNCDKTENLHYAYGYGWAGWYCFEHCPNRRLGEGCDHTEEHETELKEMPEYQLGK